MLAPLWQSDRRAQLNFAFLAIFLGIVLFFGGASRVDVLSQPLVRLAAIALIAIAAAQLRPDEWRRVRAPVFFLVAIAVIIAVQLIPLPPSWWAQLPGRALYVEVLRTAGIPEVWRPLSTTPDLTLNTLLAVLPPLAVVLGLGMTDRSLHVLLVPLMIVGVALSALVGLLQIAGGGFYLYQITNTGSAVGVFANRNHEALFLASAFPLLAAWTALPHPDRSYRRLRTWLALCMAASIFPILLITGSRGGLILGLIGAVLALGLAATLRRSRSRNGEARPSRTLLLWFLPPLLGILAVASTLFLARGEALRRLSEGAEFESRIVLLPVFVQMIRDFFPFGSGYGSFDPVYRGYEPDTALSPNYLNHAHNDLAQILIEGGILPLFLLLVFLAWFVARSWRLWKGRPTEPRHAVARAGSIIVLLILFGSLVDYPLRTPLIAAVMAIACLWMMGDVEGGAGQSPAKSGLAAKEE